MLSKLSSPRVEEDFRRITITGRVFGGEPEGARGVKVAEDLSAAIMFIARVG
jgi:hypothetical protein